MYAQLHSKDDDKKMDALNPRTKMLLIRRSRIVKKASNKLNVINEIITERYNSKGRWIVYCEDEMQLNSVVKILRGNHKHKVILTYHSKMNTDDRNRSITFFEDNPSIIVSIRCLDEGVDVPQADGAIILASSTNPRQYIQRRGRVLRKAKKKKIANIVDVLVLPKNNERGVMHSIIRSELARAWNFAQHATNREMTHELWKICMAFDVDIEVDAIQEVDADREGDMR